MVKKTIIKSFLVASALAVSFTSCALGDAFADMAKSVYEESGLKETVDTGRAIVSSVKKTMEDITPEDSYYIGRSVAANILTNYKVYSDRDMEIYLNKICQALVLNSSDPFLYNGYHVKVLNSTEVNAFSTPGGHILITKGLIDCAQTEDALAAVIAHEIAHIQLKHSLNSIKNSRFKDASDTILSAFSDDSNTLGDVSDDIVSSLFSSGFSQGQEFDADEEAIRLMAAAGYSPSAMISMLEVMKTHENPSSKSGFFKTHPSPSLRIKNIKSAVKKAAVEDTMSYRESRYNKAMN